MVKSWMCILDLTMTRQNSTRDMFIELIVDPRKVQRARLNVMHFEKCQVREKIEES